MLAIQILRVFRMEPKQYFIFSLTFAESTCEGELILRGVINICAE